MKSLFVATLATTALAFGAANAADLPTKAPRVAAPAPVAAYSWTGCYVGAGGGYGMFDQEARHVDPAQVSNGGAAIKNDNGGRGWFGTVQVGCDLQIGSSIVIGAFGDYDWSSIKGDMSIPDFEIVGREKLKNSWAAGGRIGWVPWTTTQLLVYVSGGWTEARFNHVTFTFADGGPTSFLLPKHTYSGWFIGSGYEYGLAFFPGLFWKTEYHFADYGTDRLALFTTTTGLPRGDFLDSRKFVQTIRSELVWRFNFGGFGAPVAARY